MRKLLPAMLAALLVCGCAGGSHHASGESAPSPASPAQSQSPHAPGWGATPKGLFALPAPVTNVPSVEMFDTITLATIPPRPFALAGYTSGHWPTFVPLRRAYPTTHVVSIAVSSGYHADCLDVEPGDASPSQAGPWARANLAAGFSRPCLYGDLSNMPAIRASLAASLGPSWRARVFLWLAWYRDQAGLIAGYDAVQWTDHAGGRNLDESTVTFPFLMIAQPPYVPPKPGPSPVDVRRLHAAYRLRATLRTLRLRHACATRPSPRSYGRPCRVWTREGQAVAHAIKVLHAKGA